MRDNVIEVLPSFKNMIPVKDQLSYPWKSLVPRSSVANCSIIRGISENIILAYVLKLNNK